MVWRWQQRFAEEGPNSRCGPRGRLSLDTGICRIHDKDVHHDRIYTSTASRNVRSTLR